MLLQMNNSSDHVREEHNYPPLPLEQGRDVTSDNNHKTTLHNNNNSNKGMKSTGTTTTGARTRPSRPRGNKNNNSNANVNALSSSYKRLSSSTKRLGGMPLLRMNASISSICEEEAVVCFDDSGLTDMSSLSFMTCSSSSLCLLPPGPVTQGPSLFEEGIMSKMDPAYCSVMAPPRMPQRAHDSRCNLSLSATNLDLSQSSIDDYNGQDIIDDFAPDDDDEASTGSLTLEDILEESAHSTSTATTINSKTRQWNKSKPSSLHQHSNKSFGLDSSTSIQYSDVDDDDDDVGCDDDDDDDTISYNSSSSNGSFAGGDSFSKIRLSSSRCAV